MIEALFHIQTKEGTKVPFKLNGDQRRYDLMRTRKDLIPKARQRGFSSLGIAYQCVDCLGKEGTRAVLISHEAKATQRLLDKARYYFQYMNGPAPELGRHSRNEFFFPGMESTFYIGTAGAKAFGRGDTITHLHISEYAWWESDALKQVAGLFQAVPKSGTIRIESTGNGRTNDFYYMIENAEELGYKICFAPWWDNDEYQIDPVRGWAPEGYEHYFQDMQSKHNLTEAQLYWYWIKLLEFRMDLRYMQQEYPSELLEAFQATGGSVYPDVSRTKSEYWKTRYDNHDCLKAPLRIEYLEGHPRNRRTYVVGADASGGTGNDETAVQVFCLETLEQILEFGNKNIDPVMLAHLLIHYGNKYNEAFLVVEGNMHGIATHSLLIKHYNRQRIYKRILPTRSGKVKYGFNTTENTKQELVGSTKECMEHGIAIYGRKTIKQMSKFEEDPLTGRMGAPEDGLVIALGLACTGILKYRRYAYTILEDPRMEEAVNWEKTRWLPTFGEMYETITKRNKRTSMFGRQLRT